MARYERQEHLESTPFTASIKAAKPSGRYEPDDTKDLENLLNISNENVAQSPGQAPNGLTQEKPK
jgi:hypothetical protein